MTIKAKLTKLEKRLGVTRCPHCGATGTRRDSHMDSLSVTDEERDAVVAGFLDRYFDQFDQEQLLQRLADADPAKRQSIAHVYPLGGRAVPPSDAGVVSNEVQPLDLDL